MDVDESILMKDNNYLKSENQQLRNELDIKLKQLEEQGGFRKDLKKFYVNNIKELKEAKQQILSLVKSQDLQEMNSELIKENKSAHGQMKLLKKAQETQAKIIEKLNEDIRQRDRKLNEEKEENERLKQVIEKMELSKEERKKVEITNDILNVQIETLKSTIQDFKEREVVEKEVVKKLENEVKKKENFIRILEEDTNKFNIICEELRKELEEKMHRVKGNFKERIKEKEEEIQKLILQNGELIMKMKLKEQETDDFKNEKQREIAKLRADIKALQKEKYKPVISSYTQTNQIQESSVKYPSTERLLVKTKSKRAVAVASSSSYPKSSFAFENDKNNANSDTKIDQDIRYLENELLRMCN